jgi:hypothetical protein
MIDDVLTASGSVTRTERALQLYDLALAVLRAKGIQSSSGSIAVTVYSKELLTIRYWQNKRQPRGLARTPRPHDRAMGRRPALN